MAAEIKPLPSPLMPKSIIPVQPILLSKIDSDNNADHVGGVLIQNGKAVISISDDKVLRVWQQRETGQFWTSVYHHLPSSPSCLFYLEDNRELFVGVENGTVMEFHVSKDLNSIHHKRDYLSHTATVTGVIYTRNSEWVLSVSKDKFFSYHCVETGRRLGGHLCSAACTSLEYDVLSNHAFVGDFTGLITMIKLEENGYQVITTLKGHNGSVRALAWDPFKKLLFSGSYDQTVIVWDVGGNKGTSYELQGHMSKVTSLKFLGEHKRLISGGEDCMVIFWDMASIRKEAPEWIESDFCQYCNRPFFWNIRAMVDQKQIGLRQHHCRKCGKAVCDNCSSRRSNIPIMGFEYEVRICDSCLENTQAEERTSLAKFQEVKHSVVCLDYNESSNLLLTVGTDGIIKIWDVKHMLKESEESSASTSY